MHSSITILCIVVAFLLVAWLTQAATCLCHGAPGFEVRERARRLARLQAYPMPHLPDTLPAKDTFVTLGEETSNVCGTSTDLLLNPLLEPSAFVVIRCRHPGIIYDGALNTRMSVEPLKSVFPVLRCETVWTTQRVLRSHCNGSHEWQEYEYKKFPVDCRLM